MNVDKVVFRTDLYPRIEKSPATVQKYAEDLSVLPPIEVNQHGELIDGWHRWTAHKKNELVSIEAIVTQTTSDMHLLELAIERNAVHGLQLSQKDKQSIARRIYHITPSEDRAEKKKQLAKILSVNLKSVNNWLSRIDKDFKAEQDQKILDMWLACYTQQEIADEVNVSREKISDFGNFGNIAKITKIEQNPAANHLDPFKPPIYNIWKQQTKSDGVSHFGNSESTWLDNLLYLYTDPLDTIVDPFGGGGSTIDLCKKRKRRYWVSDRAPIVEREDIRKHDITNGLPALARWKDVKLVYLDPPYWKQAEGKYSNDPTDLSNMTVDNFHETLANLIKQFGQKLSGAYIALIIQPTQWAAPEKQYTDHIAEMLKRVKLPVDMRFSVPYESQQYNAQAVNYAKDNKICLVLTREIIVWKVI